MSVKKPQPRFGIPIDLAERQEKVAETKVATPVKLDSCDGSLEDIVVWRFTEPEPPKEWVIYGDMRHAVWATQGQAAFMQWYTETRISDNRSLQEWDVEFTEQIEQDRCATWERCKQSGEDFAAWCERNVGEFNLQKGRDGKPLGNPDRVPEDDFLFTSFAE